LCPCSWAKFNLNFIYEDFGASFTTPCIPLMAVSNAAVSDPEIQLVHLELHFCVLRVPEEELTKRANRPSQLEEPQRQCHYVLRKSKSARNQSHFPILTTVDDPNARNLRSLKLLTGCQERGAAILASYLMRFGSRFQGTNLSATTYLLCLKTSKYFQRYI
jgi:hypothetical protein